MKLLFAFAVIAAVALAGCSTYDVEVRLPGSSDAPAASTPDPASSAQSEGTTTVSSRCGGSLEGCFSYNEMDEYLNNITPMIASFFEATYPDVGQPRDIVYIARGLGARTSCGISDSQAYEYCAANQTIYIGQDLLWAFYKQAGDAAPALGLAHEWAHHLQFLLDLPAFGVSSQSVNVENQADCIAGAWAQYADGEGWFESDDTGDADTLLQLIGSRETRSRDHGTAAERLQAFEAGFEGGIKACNSYFPRSPIA